MGAGTAAHADMRGTVRPLGGSQVTPRYPEVARRLGIEGTVQPNNLLSDTDVAISNIAGYYDKILYTCSPQDNRPFEAERPR
jgi:hypothetical protein